MRPRLVMADHRDMELQPGCFEEVSEESPNRPARTNIFVMATIYSGDASTPVKVRNLSPHGALIEGKRVPRAGAEVVLRRGELSASGTVVWCDEGRAGLKFNHETNVGYWLPGGEDLYRSELISAAFQDPKEPARSLERDVGIPSPTVSVSDLRTAEQSLKVLADALANDPEIIKNYGSQLQSLDAAIQLLNKIAKERQ